jgi:eukaryotic-like serine/threonine-protein kinase
MSQKPLGDNGAADGAPRRDQPPMDATAVLTPTPGAASAPSDATLPTSQAPGTGRPSGSSLPARIGRYEIVERVGRGGMGVLYRGIDPVLDREVAIKLMIDFADDNDQLRPRFQREARAIAKLQHRNIVTVFEFAEDEGTPYIVMEFLRGACLATRATAPPPLSIDEKIDIVAQLCAGLGYAHEQGIVHRDVKPANIFLLPDGSVKLLDFGIAKLASSNLTRQGEVLGSPAYMSPEQIMGLEAVDGRSDVFSAGVVLYELLAGRRPFDGDTTPTIVMKILNAEPPALDTIDPSIPPQLASIVTRALHKDPAQRFQTAAELARELQAVKSVRIAPTIVGDPPIGPKTLAGDAAVTPMPAVSAAPRRNLTLAVALGGGVLVAAAALAIALGPGRSRPTPADATKTAAASTAPPPPRALAPDRSTVPPPAPPDAPATPRAATTESSSKTTATVPGARDATPRAAAGATLRVTSEPAGAAITLDGRDTRQLTPASIVVNGTGTHRLRVSKRGFQAVDARLSAADLQSGAVSYTLSAAEAAAPSAPQIAVSATGAYPFAIYDGGRVLSQSGTSHQITVPAGKKVRLVAPEYSLNQTVTIEDTPDRTVSVQAPALGRLTIRSSQETCTVQIGDRVLGYPPVNNIAIAGGSYQVDIVCPNGRTRSEFVNIVGGQSHRVIVQ